MGDLLSSRLVLESPWGLVFLFVLPVLGLSLLRSLRRGRALWTALGLRVVGVILVALAIAGLGFEKREAADDLCIVVAADLSESVGPDGVASRERLVTDLLGHLRRGDRLGAVAFATRAEVVEWPGSPPSRPAFSTARVDAGATRLAAGIEASVPLCPEQTARKVVLVTDGNETLGDARRAAALARQTDVALYAVVPGAAATEGFSFEKLVAPPLVREGSMFPLRLVIRSRSSRATDGVIDLLLNGDVVAEQPVRFDPGVNVFEIPYQLNERGSYRLAARVHGADSATEHRRELSLAVAGPIRALVVTASRDPALARALRLKDVDVEFTRPGDFPPLEDLLQYHCVIVDDVPRKSFSDESLEVLESYVRSFGGGFVMAGGVRSFGDKEYQSSAVERILPVGFIEQKPAPKGRAPMGVFLLVDRSNSMSYNSRRRDVRDGEKMSYARQAAAALVSQLRPEDRVGVIAFDSDPYVLGPLKPLSEHRNTLNDRIARLLPGGGTDFKASLEIAAAQLASSGLGLRHVILLTDGDTNRGAKDHASLIEALSRMGISVTTIRIGDDDVNLELLQEISAKTGGRFYHVQDIERLPQLIVSDTRRRSDEPPGEKPEEALTSRYPLGLGEPSPVVQGFDEPELPVLRQLVESRIKPGADEVVFGRDGAKKVPLLATWQYGLGRTAAFTLDPTSADAASWASWPGFGKLWSQLVRWAIREETPWETRQTIRFEEGHAVLEVQTFDHREEGTITAQIFTAPQASIELELVPVAPRLFRAPLPPLSNGRYALLLTRGREGKPLAQKRDVLVLDGALEQAGTPELARRLPDMELLREITTDTGGSLNPSLTELTSRRGATRSVRQRMDVMLVPLALAMFLGDIWIRRRLDT